MKSLNYYLYQLMPALLIKKSFEKLTLTLITNVSFKNKALHGHVKRKVQT